MLGDAVEADLERLVGALAHDQHGQRARRRQAGRVADGALQIGTVRFTGHAVGCFSRSVARSEARVDQLIGPKVALVAR